MEKHYRKTYQTGSKALFFAQSLDQNETWVPLLEKAYAKAHGDYASLAGGWIGEGLEDLSGGVTTELFTSDILDLDEFWDNELSKVNQEFLFGCSTGVLEHGYGNRDGITEGHAYIVMEARTLKSGQRLVKLRNPWGKIRKGLWEGPWSDGSKEWTTEVQEELGHKFGSDSVFWISYEDMINKYTLLDRTRLFRDPDWRCCQRWIGADVPWKPDYHEKFQIKLKEDSPLILKLTQLDDRYFKGLGGQYSFRLHFRLHALDDDGGEDYIVRSHGSYLTDRSVSIELPDMPAGEYAVYVKIVGERSTSLRSVEEVVKRECQNRVENEKLASVGYAYDLAHSKAWDHMNKVANVRRKLEQKKASTLRQKERRRLWEKRHLNRDANRKQTDKNKEKKKERRDAWDEEQRKIEEKNEAEEKVKKEAEEAAENAKKQAEENPVDKAGDEADTEESESDDESEDEDDAVELKATSNSTGSPQDTPTSEKSTVVISSGKKQEVPEVAGGPPPVKQVTIKNEVKDETKKEPEEEAKAEEAKPEKTRPKYDSDRDSSDSPVEEWDELYSSDDMVRKPRIGAQPQPPPRDTYDTEEENMPEPWNAICIVGIRIYSKDPDLELRTVIEGGELLERGQGEKGAADLDNAQANAGGSRGGVPGGVVSGSGFYAPVVDRDGGTLTPGMRNGKMRDYINNFASAESSAMNSPMLTPSAYTSRRLEKN